MKKIMFMLAFVSIGLYTNANNTKANISMKPKMETIAKKQPTKVLTVWQVTVTCNGHSYTVSGFATYEEADCFGDIMIETLCY